MQNRSRTNHRYLLALTMALGVLAAGTAHAQKRGDETHVIPAGRAVRELTGVSQYVVHVDPRTGAVLVQGHDARGALALELGGQDAYASFTHVGHGSLALDLGARDRTAEVTGKPNLALMALVIGDLDDSDFSAGCSASGLCGFWDCFKKVLLAEAAVAGCAGAIAFVMGGSPAIASACGALCATTMGAGCVACVSGIAGGTIAVCVGAAEAWSDAYEHHCVYTPW